MTFSITRAMASGQEVHFMPCCRMVEGQRMPRSWLIMVFTSMPERSASDARRAVASDWEGQPPALPVLVNTSQIPCSS